MYLSKEKKKKFSLNTESKSDTGSAEGQIAYSLTASTTFLIT